MRKRLLMALLAVAAGAGLGMKATEGDAVYFVLGTLDEYLGWRPHGGEYVVDNYYPHERAVAERVATVVREEFPDAEVEREETGHLKLRSQTLADTVERIYTAVAGEREEGGFFGRELTAEAFSDDGQRRAYLAGAFLRYGQTDGGKYWLRFANSGGKARLCAQLLRELGCSDAEVSTEQTVPAGNTVTFTPTTELKALFDKMWRTRWEQKKDSGE